MPPLTARAVIVSLLKTEGYGVVRWAIRSAWRAVVEGVLVRYQGVTGRRGWAESFRPTFLMPVILRLFRYLAFGMINT